MNRPGSLSQDLSRPDQPVKATSTLLLPPKAVRVVIAGGGTGGHVIPALGIGEALKQRNPESELLFIGSDRGIEAEMIRGAGYRLEEFAGKGFPRRFSMETVRSAWGMFQNYKRMQTLIKEFKPDVLVGTGGYVMVPAVMAAKQAKVPIVLQEQNSVPGRANKFLSRYATEVHIHFSEARRFFKDRGKLRLSGNPVRVSMPEGRAHRTLHHFRLHADCRTVVVLGGSLGAHSINTAFKEMLHHFRGDRSVQFLIQTGKADYDSVANAVKDAQVRVVVKSFLKNMEEIYSIADLVVARSGAMTVSELSACGLPSILVPYPHAMNDHQRANAKALADKGAAVMLPDEDLSGKSLAIAVKQLLSDPAKLRNMANNAYGLNRPHAAMRIAESVERVGGGAPQAVLHLPEDYDTVEEES